jgi:undecaprenyl-diphosphatase
VGLHYRARVPDPSAARPGDPARTRAQIGLVVAVTAAVVLTIAVAAGGQHLSRLDDPLTEVTRGWADALGWPVEVARVIGALTQPALAGALVAILALWLLRRGLGAAAGLLAISGISGALITSGVKALMQRDRPASAQGLVRDMTASFPSGHSSAGIYLFLAAGLVLLHVGRANGRKALTRAGAVLIVVGPLIGVSRLVLGAHWPSDILAGWAFGSAALLIAALLLWEPLARGWRYPANLEPFPSRDRAR